jgi:uncharacterized protein (TIGR03437 family)
MTNTRIVFNKLRGVFLIPFAIGVSFGQMPVVPAGGTVNGASFASGQPIAPGSLASIFGTQFAAATALADSVPLSTTIGETSVTFNGVPAPLYFVSPGQINAQVPYGTTIGSANVIVTRGGLSSPAQPVVINQVAPGVFTANGYAIAYFGAAADPRFGDFAAPVGTFPNSLPAHPGDVLTVYATGLGAVSPSVQDGFDSSDTLRNTVVVPTVLVGNVPAQLFFSGLTTQFPGVYQLNIAVPQVPTGNSVPIQIEMNGVTSPASAIIAVISP